MSICRHQRASAAVAMHVAVTRARARDQLEVGEVLKRSVQSRLVHRGVRGKAGEKLAGLEDAAAASLTAQAKVSAFFRGGPRLLSAPFAARTL